LEFTQVMTPVFGAAVKIWTGNESMIVLRRLSDGGGISGVSVIDGPFAGPFGADVPPPGVVAAGSDWKEELKSAPYEWRTE
jgi:hypothetical protein